MDKSWMDELNRFGEKYTIGVDLFLKFAAEHVLNEDNTIRCPCNTCRNMEFKTLDDVRRDLHTSGFLFNYKDCIFHGEDVSLFNIDDSEDEYDIFPNNIDNDHSIAGDNNENDDVIDELDELLEDMQEAQQSGSPFDKDNESFDRLLIDAQREVYPGCEYSLLSAVVHLLHMKVLNKWTNKSFNMLLEFMKKLLPKGEILPSSLYGAKKLLSGLGLGCQKIEVCKYDCALFWKEHAGRIECPICFEPRWKIHDGKGKKIPHKVLRYFPLTPRLQRLFMSKKIASDMRWHKEKRVDDGKMRHPADSPAWKDFDKQHIEFSQDCRSVRLGLATDGFNPFGDLSNSYSMWPVVLIPYNLPPYKFMKEAFLMMSLLIPGPRAPGKDIDVFLRPLIDELKALFEGVETYDVVAKEKFQMRAALLWTINDFPAYGSLSGWVTQGYFACPCCLDGTNSQRLRSKICYMGHRRFLNADHAWRKNKTCFNGKQEFRPRPAELSGIEVAQWLEDLEPLFDKFGKHPSNRKRKRGVGEGNWVKKSIFFELPYWSTLPIRHVLDVMHIERNYGESILGTILDIPGRTKDTEKAREDLRDMKIRKELHLQNTNSKLLKPVACFTMSSNEKRAFYEFLKSVKFPDGYAANISKCVKEGKISGLKAHDYHVLLQRLIPAGVRGYLRKDVCEALYELGEFFKDLCSKTLIREDIDKMEKNAPLILCKLEKIFPPAFFDIMIHLAVHLPTEAKIAGPVHARWMFPIERYLGTLKRYVRNRARPEGSIAEGYIANECLTFLSIYLPGIETKFSRIERNFDGGNDKMDERISIFSAYFRPFGRVVPEPILSEKDLEVAHWYILSNCEEVRPYMEMHKEQILDSRNSNNINQAQREHFPIWFKEHMNQLHYEGSQEATNDLWALANGPDRFTTKIYSGCFANEVRFHTKDREERCRTQNSGLVVEGEHNGKTIEFFGFLKCVVELPYLCDRKVVLFQCEWFDMGNKKTVVADKNFISIDIRSRWYKDDPFVLPEQVQQVFYINDTKLGKNWQLVQRVQHRHLWDLPVMEEERIPQEETDNAFQQYQSFGVIPVVEGQDFYFSRLNREDVAEEIISENRSCRLNQSISQQPHNRDFVLDDNEELYTSPGTSEDEEYFEDDETNIEADFNI